MFSRRWLINYLLLVLIIIFTWIGMKSPELNQQLAARNNIITGLAAQDISRIRVETPDSTLQLEKQGSRWMLTAPLQWFANNVSAERLATLATLQAESTLPRRDIDLSSLGLSLPKAVVTLNDQPIYFGDTNQIGNRRYLLVEPNVYLGSDIHYPFIAQGLAALLDNRLLPAAVELQTLKAKGFTIRKDNEQWSAEPPKYTAQSAGQLVNHWQTKAASSIKPFDKTMTPLQRITASTGTAGDIEFFLLAIKPEIILARPDLGLQYHFPDFNYYDLLSLERPDE